MKKQKENNQNQSAMRTISFRAQSRLSWLSKREKNICEKINSVQKQIDALPTLQKRLEELKTKQQKIQEQRATEIKEIEELISTFKNPDVNAPENAK